jgi:hypothetical protein
MGTGVANGVFGRQFGDEHFFIATFLAKGKAAVFTTSFFEEKSKGLGARLTMSSRHGSWLLTDSTGK